MKEHIKKISFNRVFYGANAYSQREMLSEINGLASYLSENKKSHSPFIYLFAKNNVKTIVAYFAILKSGSIAVLVEPEIGKLELKEKFVEVPPCALIRLNVENDCFDYKEEVGFKTVNGNNINKSELDDVCTIAFSAAEDGFAKAIMLTYKNMLSMSNAIRYCDKIDKDSICCALLPFHHIYGLQTGVLAPVLSGASILIEDVRDLTRIKSIVCDLECHNVSNIYSLPIIYYLLAKIPDVKRKLRGVKGFVSGGYKLSHKIFNSFMKNIGKEIHEGYGLTEASPICTWHRPEDEVKIDSVGREFGCCRIKIFDEKNKEVPPFKVGEICVEGDNVMKGYYGKKDYTDEVIRNGWLKTGDLGSIDDDGYLFISGLKKEMFNVAGRNVYHREVERLMLQNLEVEEVRIYCEPSDVQGDILRGDVKLKHNTEQKENSFVKWCKENISYYKIPGNINFH
ncbi:AMP-binding protein [Fibrobacterota bacterium]